MKDIFDDQKKKSTWVWALKISGGSRGGETGGPGPSPSFLDQTKAPKGRKDLFKTAPLLIQGSGWQGPPSFEGLDPPLKIQYSQLDS